MKKTIVAGGVAVLALAAAGGAAFAQAEARSQAQPSREAAREASITRDAFVDRRLQRLSAMDANGDGTVTAEEMRAAAQARRAERVASRFDRLDADKDGVISRGEFEARQAAPGGPRAGQRGEGPRRAFAHGRRGPDGAARMARPGGERGPLVLADVRARTGEAFDRMDANRDGVVTADERRAAFEARQEQRRERRMERRTSPSAPASE